MRILVAGSRELNPEDYADIVYFIASSMSYKIEWVTGCARGIDEIAERLAIDNLDDLKRFPADWNKHGKAAGPIRNKEMAEYCDAAIIIWDGKSKGTKNMIDLMYKTTKPTIVYKIT